VCWLYAWAATGFYGVRASASLGIHGQGTQADPPLVQGRAGVQHGGFKGRLCGVRTASSLSSSSLALSFSFLFLCFFSCKREARDFFLVCSIGENAVVFVFVFNPSEIIGVCPQRANTVGRGVPSDCLKAMPSFRFANVLCSAPSAISFSAIFGRILPVYLRWGSLAPFDSHPRTVFATRSPPESDRVGVRRPINCRYFYALPEEAVDPAPTSEVLRRRAENRERQGRGKEQLKEVAQETANGRRALTHDHDEDQDDQEDQEDQEDTGIGREDSAPGDLAQ
jgi:hypothetical protein